jgi:hypothetical protein
MKEVKGKNRELRQGQQKGMEGMRSLYRGHAMGSRGREGTRRSAVQPYHYPARIDAYISLCQRQL